ncbi:hypothetical protein [Niallia sp. BSM11]|uniref:hypothetical protein n=1 Tax=Niallia sp. BSM11 TaxID=3391576 RepID=UPI0039849AD6
MAQNYKQVGWKDHVKDGTTGAVLQQGTPVSASNLNKMDAGIELAHQKLEGANRQVQSIGQGMQVLNGDVNAPVSIQMDGRTLVSLQNTELDASKFYVLADKRTKVKFSDSLIVQGVNKFQGVNAKPQIITRIANYENKSAGSNTDNPHIAKSNSQSGGTWNVLQAPSAFQSEFSGAYSTVSKLDGAFTQLIQTVAGNMAQGLLSYNVVEEIERNVGRIPRNTFAEKVQWIKENVAKIICNLHGYGKGPSGYKISLQRWTSGAWTDSTSSVHTSSSVAKVAQGASDSPSVNTLVQSDGFVHFIAFAEAADATSQSQVNIDYVELEIELKSTAVLHAPRIPLYEVSKEQYDNILVNWNEEEVIRRYPMVEGYQHVQNPFIIAEGDNLIPTFNEASLSIISSDFVIKGDYEIDLQTTGPQTNTIEWIIKVIPGQKYSFFVEEIQKGTGGAVVIRSQDLATTIVWQTPVASIQNKLTFTVPAGITRISVRLFNSNQVANVAVTLKNPMLVVGENIKPFVPRNPSYLFVEAKLGSIGNYRDLLLEEDGKMMMRKIIEKDYVADGTLGWFYRPSESGTGFKTFGGPISDVANVAYAQFIKYNGALLRYTSANAGFVGADIGYVNNIKEFKVSVSNAETGFAETYAPAVDEIKAYFNGWKVKTYDTTTLKPTAWTSLVDGTDAPTQTLAYVAANKSNGYIPYKISYMLNNLVLVELRSEGAISVNGLTQVEVGSGSIIREKVRALHNAADSLTYINALFSASTAQLKNPAIAILAVYKGNMLESDWNIQSSINANGKVYASKKTSLVDTNAEYFVSYIIYDKSKFSTNVIGGFATFANNIRTALDDNIKRTEDNKRDISVNTLFIYDMLKRLQAGGL